MTRNERAQLFHNPRLKPCPDFKADDVYTESGDDQACPRCAEESMKLPVQTIEPSVLQSNRRGPA